MTISKLIKRERTKQYLSLADVGMKAGLTRATIWKMEKGHLPKGETFVKVITDGLGFKEGGEKYNEAVAMWTNERLKSGQQSAIGLAEGIADQEKEISRTMRLFLKKLQKLNPEELQEIEKAIVRPAVIKGIFALNDIYDRKKS